MQLYRVVGFGGLMLTLTLLLANPISTSEEEARVNTSIKWARLAYSDRIPPSAESYADPNTGFRSLIKIEKGNPDTIIVSFRGTANAGGVFSNVSLNYPQFQTPEFLKTLRRVRQLLRTRENNARILVTGHSSGGGLAEAFAYEIVDRADPEEKTKIKVDLYTWNGIGAADWYEYRNKNFSPNPENTAQIRAIHFRSSPDYVSRLGRHFVGETWTWNSNKNFVGGHAVPVDFDEVKAAGLVQETPKNSLGFLTGTHVSRVTFVTGSYALITAKGACKLVLSRTVFKVSR